MNMIVPTATSATPNGTTRPQVRIVDALEPARPLETLALRLPVQAIYKFDDRRIVAGRIESGSLATGDEIVIMPAGKIAKLIDDLNEAVDNAAKPVKKQPTPAKVQAAKGAKR